MRERQLFSHDPSENHLKMATDYVDQNKSERSEICSSSEWSATTGRMVIEFYKENKALWDKNHKDYGKNSFQKKLFTPLVAKLTRSNVPKSEPEIKKRWHNLRTSALRYFRKQSSGGGEVKWTYWKDMSFLHEQFAAEVDEESKSWSEQEIDMLISFFQENECLWNHNIPTNHHKSQNKDLLYDLLSKELDDKYDSSDIHKKWKELENKFKQEHSKALVKPSGSGTDEIYKPTFPFYNQLLFPTAICETDETMESIEEPPDPKPRKKSKRKIQEDREDRKLELMSEAIQAMKEKPSTRMQDQGGMVENVEAVAFGTYVGLTLSKLSNRKFRQAKKCISDILYNIEEGEEASASNVPCHDHHFEIQSRSSTPSSFETFHGHGYNSAAQYTKSYNY